MSTEKDITKSSVEAVNSAEAVNIETVDTETVNTETVNTETVDTETSSIDKSNTKESNKKESNKKKSNSKKSNTRKKTQLHGIFIILVIFLPMALAYVMFYTGWGVSKHTTNKGDLLIPPQAIQSLTLNNHSNALKKRYSANESSKKKWRILIPVSRSCDKACQSHLYLSQQVHIRLAEKAYRVERILLLLASLPNDEIERLEREHPNSLILHSSSIHLNEWLKPTLLPQSAEQYFYLIDQEGFAMMRYSTEHSGQDLLDDIKKLLKFTYSQ